MKKLVVTLIFLVSFLLVRTVFANVVINEIMYNPSGSDNNREWVEIYNSGNVSVNLTGWKFYEADTNHGLILKNGSMVLGVGDYGIIADDWEAFLSDYPDFTKTLFDSSYSLSNSGEGIAMKNSTGDVVENVTYSDSAEEGNTLCRIPDGGSFVECVPTPGSENRLAPCPSGVCINITSYPENLSSLQAAVSFTVQNNNDANITLDVGAWVSGITDDHWPSGHQNQLFQANETKSYEYIIELNELPEMVVKELKAGVRFAEDHSNQSLAVVNVNLVRIIAKPSIDSIVLSPAIPSSGDNINVTINFTNTDDDTDYAGNLTVKIKSKVSGSWEDYQTILSQTDFVLRANGTRIFSFNWSVPDDAISGLYDVYTRFDYWFEGSVRYRTKTEEFDVSGLGNVFLTFWNITSPRNLTLGDSLDITVNITNNETEAHGIGLNIIIEDLKTVTMGKHDEIIDCGTSSLENKTSVVEDCTLALPNDVITNGIEEFDIFPRINFTYHNTTITRIGDSKKINITGLADLGDSELAILSSPSQTRFGGFSMVFVKFYSGNYKYSETKFLAYAYPKQILMDLDGNGITASSYDSNVVVNISGVQRDQNIYLTLPLFLKHNCDDYYSDGSYRIRVRTYKPESSMWKEIITEDFNLSVSGRNEGFCPKPVEVSGGGGTKTVYENVTVKVEKQPPYEITSYPATVYAGDEFTTTVRLTADKAKNVTVYSYVFDSKKILSEGFGDEGWSKKWTANKKQVELAAGSSVDAILVNRIPEGTPPGSYKYRVRIKDEEDITKDIVVLSKPLVVAQMSISVPKVNMTCKVVNDDSIFINMENEEGIDATLSLFSGEGTEARDISITNRTREIITPKGDGYFHFLLTKDGRVLGDCSVRIEKPMGITGSFSLVGDFFSKLGEGISHWFKSVLGL